MRWRTDPSRVPAVLVYASLFALAVSLRWRLFEAPPFGEDAGIFYVAANWWRLPTNIDDIYGTLWFFYNGHEFFRRPLYFILMHPAATVSFDAYRAQGIVLTSLLPVAATSLLRAKGVRWPLALGAGTALAIHPYFVLWGATYLEDAVMTAFLLLALLAYEKHRLMLGTLLLGAAACTKEMALVPLGILWLMAVIPAWKKGQIEWWPVRLNEVVNARTWALGLGLIPVAAMVTWGKVPGPTPSSHNDTLTILDQALHSLWFLPILLLGLRWRRSRELSVLALGVALGFAVLDGVLGRSINVWYYVLPATLAIVASAASLDAWMSAMRGAKRALPILAGCVAASIILVGAFAPPSIGKRLLTNPLASAAGPDLETTIAQANDREPLLWPAIDAMGLSKNQTVLTIDLFFPYSAYPISHRAGYVLVAQTFGVTLLGQALDPYAQTIESVAQTTLLAKNPHPLNEAIRETYRDCVTFENAGFLVLRGADCEGRLEQLRSEYVARSRSKGTRP